jgi:hypothetical protein
MIHKKKYKILYPQNNRLTKLIPSETTNSFQLISIIKVIQIQQNILISNLSKKNSKENNRLKKRFLSNQINQISKIRKTVSSRVKTIMKTYIFWYLK